MSSVSYAQSARDTVDFTGSMLDPDNQWNVTKHGDYGIRFSIAEDSVLINGKWYRELLRSGDSTGNTWGNTHRYLREEGRKVYQIIDSVEYVLYDFSLEVGDTFTTVQSSRFPEKKLIVTGIDSVILLDNRVRKRIKLTCETMGNFYNYWIEGIGSTSGIIGDELNCILDLYSGLMCFYVEGELVFNNERFEECWVKTSTSDPHNLGLSIYPNPVNDKIIISGYERPMNYAIYSIQGVKMQSGRLTDRRISVKTLPQAVYFLKLSIGKKSQTVKFVKE